MGNDLQIFPMGTMLPLMVRFCSRAECQNSGVCRALVGVGIVNSAESEEKRRNPDKADQATQRARRLRAGIIQQALADGCEQIGS